MPRPKELVPFDSRRLCMDLARKAPKRIVFEARAKDANAYVSNDQLKRAKNGQATPETLAKIAKILGFGVDRYLVQASSMSVNVPDLSGSWTAIYLESPRPGKIVRTWERLHITQVGNRISGSYDFLKTDDPEYPERQYVYCMKGRVLEDTVAGFYWIEGRVSAQGVGTFQLKIRPDRLMAEGYCSFYGHDGFVAASHNYWISDNGAAGSQYYLRAAEDSLLKGQIFFEIPVR